MKNLSKTLFAVALCVAAPAFAAPPQPPKDCGLDADHDGWCVKDSDRNDKIVGTEDCNDTDPKINPGATEIVGDGLDNDCVGGDLTAEPWYKNFSCSSAACIKRLVAEVTACEAASDQCAVNKSQGKFVTTWGNYFIDTDCDGIREVLDQAGKDTHDAEVRKGKTCGRPLSSSNPSKGKPRTSKPTKPASPPIDPTRVDGIEKDTQALKGRADQVDTVLADTGDRLDTLEPVVKDHSDRIGKLEGRADGHDTAIGELGIKTDAAALAVDSAVNVARDALNTASTALGRGVNAGVTVGYLLKGQQSVAFKGETLRGGVANGVEFRGHVGAELPSVRLRGIGSVAVLGEDGPNGTEQALAFRGGAEVLMKLHPSFACGIGAGYLGHLSGGKVSGAYAESRGGYVEIPCELDLGRGLLSVPVRLAPFAGYEAIGTRGSRDGHEFRADGGSWFGGLTITVGIGTRPEL